MEEQKPIPAPEVERPLDPEAITEARKIIADVAKLLEQGEIDQIAVYLGHRDGNYRVMQNRNNGRHEDAGRLFELAIARLGFIQREDVKDVIDQL